jgi:YggT family protein
MFFILTILSALFYILHLIFFAYTWIVVIAALITWVNPDPYNRIVRTLRALTEPVLWRVRRCLPFVYTSGLDLSPLVVILAVQFLDYILVRFAAHFALSMGM